MHRRVGLLALANDPGEVDRGIHAGGDCGVQPCAGVGLQVAHPSERTRAPARKRGDLVPGTQKRPGQVGAQEAAAADEEDSHGQP